MPGMISNLLTSSRTRFGVYHAWKFYSTPTPCFVPRTEFIARRHRLAEKIARRVCQQYNSPSKHLIVLPSAELQYMAYHVPYPFLQDSNFMYFTGLKEATGALLFAMDIEPKGTSDPNYTSQEHLFIEVRSPQEEIWDGPSMKESTVSEFTGIHSTSSLGELSNFLKFHSKDYTLWYAPLVEHENDKRPLNKFILSEIFKTNDALRKNVRSPQPLIDQLRLVKSESEIRCLRYAANATADCLRKTIGVSFPGVSEDFIRSKLEFESRLCGLTLGYPPVVAGADRANVIHYLRTNHIIEDGDLVLVDVGCRAEGYTADLTRTWPVNGRFSPMQLVLHEILIETLKKCSSIATPDQSLSDLHHIMLQELRRHLVGERILPQTDSLALIQKVCPHHVGHYLGLDIHDTPTISYSRRLEAGVVFPLEPGIYLRPELGNFGVPKEWLGIGMRLEDDFVITDTGQAESLTDQLPYEASALESLVQSKPKIHNSKQIV